MNRQSEEGRGPLSEDSLLARARLGDTDALRLIYEEHVRGVSRLVRGVLRGAPESEDAVQQTFVKVLSSLPQTDVRLLAQWIHTIAYRTALEFLKKKLKKNEFALTEVEDLPMRSVPIDEQLERDNRAAIVENAIYGLPKRQRLAILGYLHDQPDEELAAVMGISERTVRVHRFEAIKALRARLGGKS